MLSHILCGNNSIIHISHNKKYTSNPHNMKSLASRPRIQQPSHLRTKGPKEWKKDRMEAYLVGNKDRFYILPKGQSNTQWFQQDLHSPILSFSVCNTVFWAIARIVRSQKEPNRIANQTTEVMYGEYKWDKRPVVELRSESDTVRYKR